jgi:hypothetical protein
MARPDARRLCRPERHPTLEVTDSPTSAYAQEIEPTHLRGGHLAPSAWYRPRRAPRADTRDRAGTCAWVRYALALLHDADCILSALHDPEA